MGIHRRWLEASSSLTEEPERTLKLQSAKGLASHALAAFPAVLARAQLLPTAEQARHGGACMLRRHCLQKQVICSACISSNLPGRCQVYA